MAARLANASDNRTVGVRERLTRNKPLVSIVAAALIGTGLLLIWRQLSPVRPDITVGMNFYSDDDGKTWFADSADKIPPFDHNGKPAYEVEVYRSGDGSPFVAYMTSWEPEDQAAIEAAAPKDRRDVQATLANKQLVKKPGARSWVKQTPQTAKEYQSIIAPVGPDGSSKNLEYVSPSAP